jgi:hypothetical protein
MYLYIYIYIHIYIYIYIYIIYVYGLRKHLIVIHNVGVIFTKFPPVLTVHLKRFDFDLQRMVCH